MKKKIILLIILTVFVLTGCSQKEQMTSFIPTQAPEEITEDAAEEEQEATEEGTEDGAEESGEGTTAEAAPTPDIRNIGETTPKYVKLDEYGAFLNVRPTPSTESEPVGFLVHAEKIEVIEVTDGWASFVFNDAICYVNADFLVDERPEYLDPPTPTPSPKVTPTTPPAEAEPDTEDAPATETKPEI